MVIYFCIIFAPAFFIILSIIPPSIFISKYIWLCWVNLNFIQFPFFFSLALSFTPYGIYSWHVATVNVNVNAKTGKYVCIYVYPSNVFISRPSVVFIFLISFSNLFASLASLASLAIFLLFCFFLFHFGASILNLSNERKKKICKKI